MDKTLDSDKKIIVDEKIIIDEKHEENFAESFEVNNNKEINVDNQAEVKVKNNKKSNSKIDLSNDKLALTTNVKTKRDISIDRLRGFAILCVVLSNILPFFPAFNGLKFLFQHYPGEGALIIIPGVAFADLFLAMFIFIIGLTTVKNFNSYKEKFGTKKAYFKLGIRGFVLIGLGCLVNGLEDLINILTGDVNFAEIHISEQFLTILVSGFVIFGIINLISKMYKSEKFKKIMNKILKYTIAIMGVFGVLLAVADLGVLVAETGTRLIRWDVFQAIGFSTLIALPFVSFSKWGRLAIAGIIFVCMTLFIEFGGKEIANAVVEGGFIGGFGWGAILLTGSFFEEIKGSKLYWILSATCFVVSIVAVLALGLFAAKRGCTPVYGIFCIGLSTVVWGLVRLLNNWNPKFKLFSWFGGSSILIYISALVLGFALKNVLSGEVINIWMSILITVLILAAFSFMAYRLNKKNKFIRI